MERSRSRSLVMWLLMTLYFSYGYKYSLMTNRRPNRLEVSTDASLIRLPSPPLQNLTSVDKLLSIFTSMAHSGNHDDIIGYIKSTETPKMYSSRVIRIAATRILASLSFENMLSLLSHLRDTDNLDAICVTSAMTSLIRNESFHGAMEVFECMKSAVEVDEGLYVLAVRAAGHCRPFPQVMNLLDESLLIDSSWKTSLANTALANLVHSPLRGHRRTPTKALRHVHEILTWMRLRAPLPASTLDAALAVTCRFGSIEDVSRLLPAMTSSASPFTFNTLLNFYAERGDEEGCKKVLGLFPAPDHVSFNIMLKFYIDKRLDADAARRTLRLMEDTGLNPDSDVRTRLLKMKLKCLEGDAACALDLFEKESDLSLTSFTVAGLLDALSSPALTLAPGVPVRDLLKIFQRARNLNVVNEAVVAALARALLAHHRPDVLLDLFSHSQSLHPDLWTSSSIFSVLQASLGPHGSNDHISRILDLLSSSRALTHTHCDYIMKELLKRGDVILAGKILLGPLEGRRCEADTLTTLFAQHQSLVTRASPDTKRTIAGRLLAILRLYERQPSHRSILRTQHFNSALRVLSQADMHEQARQLFVLMSSGSYSRDPWKPSTFTIAELVRLSRQQRLADAQKLAHDAIIWGSMNENTFLPLAVIRDAISFVYDAGRIDLAEAMFERLVLDGKIKLWSNEDSFIMDLHEYNRGMAYAAVITAMKQISAKKRESENDEVLLTIITGQSVGREPEEFALTNELQSILIEEIYPPLSSSTMPGNPGRLLVKCRTRGSPS